MAAVGYNAQLGPNSTSSDYAAMADYWQLVSAIQGGAKTMRASSKTYLPRFENETKKDYDRRVSVAPFTNLYVDISRNLASKPFSKEVTLAPDSASPTVEKLIEDIDGQGNNLHFFARDVFQRGLDKGIDWIFIDYTKVPPGATLADERNMGARPYWVHVPAERMLAVYSDFLGGQEIIVHARIYEPIVERNGWSEALKERIRVLDRPRIFDDQGNDTGQYGPPTYTIYQEEIAQDGRGKVWSIIEGPEIISLGEIALVPFMTGPRLGGTWRVTPPLRDLAQLQVEEFQQESNLKSVLELTCFPMLAGNGVPGFDSAGAKIVVPVGPKAVLFAPPNPDGSHGEWKYIEPSAESIKTLMAHLEDTREQMQQLGLQPLVPKTGALTATSDALRTSKANAAAQAWALGLKDSLELAFRYTAMWLKETQEAEVVIHTDFIANITADQDLPILVQMRQAGDLSQDTLWNEAKRRDFLSAEFDDDAEKEKLAEEQQGLDVNGANEPQIDPVTGQPIPNVNLPPLVPNQTNTQAA